MQQGWGQPPEYPPRVPYGYPQPPPYAPPPIDSARLRPRAWWYGAAAIPAVLAIAGAAICIVIAVKAFPDEPRPFTAPGSVVLRLDAGEDQTIYSHTRAGVGEPVADPGRPDCRVTWLEGDRPVQVGDAGNFTLTLGSDEYVAILDFPVERAGQYRVRCGQPRNADSYPLAVGKRADLALFGGMIIAAIASFFIGMLLAGGVIALVAVLRHRHKRRLQQEASGFA